MRSLKKLPEPEILATNGKIWLEEYKADKKSETKKYRYRNPDIKERLKQETGEKCIYCESKIGHNTPGDVEHIIPSSKNEEMRFHWANLTIACTECNRRKNDYYLKGSEFLNPYTDLRIESEVKHLGPIMTWEGGNNRAEITIRKLELHNNARISMILRKFDKIQEVTNLMERIRIQKNLQLRELLELELNEMTKKTSEFSAMVKMVVEHRNKR